MFDSIGEFFEIIKLLISAIIVIGTLFAILAAIFILFVVLPISAFTNHSDRHAEWEAKVNTCILNPSSRSDCELIIYKDKQNRARKSSTTFIPMFIPMSIK